jgi:phosphatidylinositol dimannoside acyltransferase
VTLRQLFTWKFFFYDAAMPLLRRLGPARADAILGLIGRVLAVIRPRRGRRISASVERAGRSLGADWDLAATSAALAANVPRYLARDYPLDRVDEQAARARFDVTGAAHLDAALADGRGLVLVGSHLGAHIAGLNWLYRHGVPLRLLVQRPRHVSRMLLLRFDHSGTHPQEPMFLRRGLAPYACVERILRARDALRGGCAVYLNGDIPWTGANARPGTLLGLTQPFLSVWADLAVLAHCPAVFVTCTHAPGGRFTLNFSPPLSLAPGDEPAAIAAYFSHLNAAISQHPADAVAHLTWPCFGPEGPDRHRRRSRAKTQ